MQKGKVISLALPYDQYGPQGGKSKYPAMGRFNPIHLMLRTGTDAYPGVLDSRKIRGSDDVIIMPTQAGTQWDGLGHIFYGDNMWNGYDCRTVTSAGARNAALRKPRTAWRRGVLLDIPRMLGMPHLPDTFAITNELLDKAEKHFGVEVRRGDYLLVRTGQMEAMLAAKSWDGYSGGDAPGLAFETSGLAAQKTSRGRSHRYLGRGSSSERDGRGQPAVALDLHPDHGPDGGRNFRPQRTVQGMRGRQALRVSVRGAGFACNGRGCISRESTSDQVAGEEDLTGSERFEISNL